MSAKIIIKGVQPVKDRLALLDKRIKRGTTKGVFDAGKFIIGEAKVPVDYGNLRQSGYTHSKLGTSPETTHFVDNIKERRTLPTAQEGKEAAGRGEIIISAEELQRSHERALSRADTIVNSASKNKAVAVLGYSAPYAFEVHEDLETPRHFGESKFLENSIRRNKQKITKMLTEKITLEMARAMKIK